MKQNNAKGQFLGQIDLGEHVRSGFDYKHTFDGTGRLGRINNVGFMKVNPADVIEGKSLASVQFEPLAVPLLNNMHVKQEAFYIPWNVVFDEFDDFISGGEDLSYQGKLPSQSLKDMFSRFLEVFQQQVDSPMLAIPFTFIVKGTYPNNYTVDITISEQEIIDSYLNFELPAELVSQLDEMQMLDLFNHYAPLCKQLANSMLAQIAAGGEDVVTHDSKKYLRLFQNGYTSADEIPSDVLNKERLLWSEAQPNEYLREIWKGVVNYQTFRANQNSFAKKFIMPTDSGMLYINYMYEFIRPFFGVSSYLDQLSYNKLRFVDYLYEIIMEISDMPLPTSGSNYTRTIYINGTYLSEQPQEILSLRAQYCVWWNNYRDQVLEVKAPKPRKSAAVTSLEVFTLLAPRIRCWHKDTFTTALDNAGTVNGIVPTEGVGHVLAEIKSRNISGQASEEVQMTDKSVYEIKLTGAEHSFKIPSGFISGMHNDTQELESETTRYFSLDLLDAAKRAQKWLRKSIFYGNRIQDFLFTRFGVKFLDARLRLPELLGTSSTMARMDAVINPTNIVTADSTAVAGDKSAVAWSNDQEGNYFKRYIEEHGIIIRNLTIMPDCVYANTFAREHAELDQFDFPFEEFATLGLDAVYDVELSQLPVKVSRDVAAPTDSPSVFGYQGRYYNYKAHHSEVHGELLDTQDKYVFGRKFNIYDPDSLPKLNYIFVHCHPFLGMFVVDNEWCDYFRYDILHAFNADRQLPTHSMYLN